MAYALRSVTLRASAMSRQAKTGVGRDAEQRSGMVREKTPLGHGPNASNQILVLEC